MGKVDVKQPRVKRMVRRCIIGLAVLLALCIGLGIWANIAVRRASRGLIFSRAEDTPARDVAIVLGARAWKSGPSSILRDRLDVGVALYKQGKVRKLVLSGDHGRREYDEVNVMRRYVLERGVPPQDVFLDHAGFRTYDTLVRARKVFGIQSAVLVTNSFHQPRSIYTAKACGIDAVGLTSDIRVYRTWLYNDCREFLARTLAWLDVNVIRPNPRFLGPAIDIRGDGRVTWDEAAGTPKDMRR